ncbi:monooxygenase 3 [Quercus suber]|uniref:Monooxygenase 3 n=2 Tax=Quercus suber TaxID=58331 RepID=A0AAW0JHE9_QUESU
MEKVEDIVIVGGGIAGLTASLGLHKLGIRSLVLESSHSLRITGFAFSAWTNAWRALDAIGLEKDVEDDPAKLKQFALSKLANVPDEIKAIVENTELEYIMLSPLRYRHPWDLIWGNISKGNVCVLGDALHPMTPDLGQGACSALEDGVVLARCLAGALLTKEQSGESTEKVDSESEQYKKIEMGLKNYAKERRWRSIVLISTAYVALIGCDGVNSVVAKWLGFKAPAFTGRAAIRGWINFKSNHGFEPKLLQFMGIGFRSGFLPNDDTSIYWFFTSNEKDVEDDPAKLKQFALSKLANVPDEIKAIVENTELEYIMLSPLRYRHPWDLIWGNISKGNVCVLGDALHPMTPDLGQGACSALEDGVVLARCLAGALLTKEQSGESTEKVDSESEQYKKIEMGLKNYAKERRWRSIVLISTAYVVGFFQQGDGKLTTFLRDKLLAAFLSSLLLKRADYDCGKLNIS